MVDFYNLVNNIPEKNLITFSENNGQTGKLNERIGFLVSSLNSLGSKEQVNDKKNVKKIGN